MNNRQAPNATIHGQGTIAGGTYHQVKVHGSAEITGDIVCHSLVVMGSASIRGNVRADRFRMHGECTLAGNLDGEDIQIRGALRVDGDCTAEQFRCTGSFNVDGLLNAGSAELRLFGGSSAKEVGGGSIRIRKPFWQFLATPDLTAESIEADELHLISTRATIVRGRRIEVGPYCDIDCVEYTDSVHTAKSATVKKMVRLGERLEGEM